MGRSPPFAIHDFAIHRSGQALIPAQHEDTQPVVYNTVPCIHWILHMNPRQNGGIRTANCLKSEYVEPPLAEIR